MLSAQEKMLSPAEMQERFVPLDPNLGNLKEADTNLNRQTNWTLIARELKKFGIIVDIITKEKLIKGNQELINNLLPLIVKYEMRRGLITELIMLDNINENNNNNENLLSEGTDSRVRTPNILAMSRSHASSICLNN
jgi:exopolysaccharide biosynthesis predicted pyruvyltransferase EpsI